MRGNKQMGFREAGARPMPKLACIGKVTEFVEAKVSASEQYIVQRFSIQGFGASRNIRDMLLYRPEWLADGFDPETLEDNEETKGLLFTYRNHISEKGKVSKLLGLCALDDEKFGAVAEALFGLSIDPATLPQDGPPIDMMEEVTEVLNDLYVEQGFADPIGYVLGQQTSKTDEVNPETGKAIYVVEPYYEVKEFFNPADKKKIASLQKAADKSEGKFKITFDDTPF